MAAPMLRDDFPLHDGLIGGVGHGTKRRRRRQPV
jgi:hypothetical protein